MHSKRVAATLAMVSLLATAHGSWYGEDVEKGADIMIRYPWWGKCTYNAHWGRIRLGGVWE